ncbi:[NiFe]-hydrogenase assembly chaperone HybE [Thiomicrorhabdus sp. Kp2]|uniref:[NiFe]-hydrogenase assembly chaperone HybE n=1 Tax=Thiomicrorhabdus sp. Kp2 TaxID=1123518 RepID=UPI0003FEC1C5|nr:[NiFe]-hydrogenase assembly chaperone HybE [Thiomicrorhabdus sp. Kp2]
MKHKSSHTSELAEGKVLENRVEKVTRPGNSDWQLIQTQTLQETHDLIVDVFKNTYHKNFEEEWLGVNHNLQVELRGFKFVDGWVTGFLLTPWMLCTIYIPVLQQPNLEIETEWLAERRQNQDYVVIGSLKTFDIGGSSQKGNLNYHPKLGHYLLQPLVQIMDKYADNESAFGAWSQVIAFRKAHYEKIEQEALAKEASLKEIEDKSKPIDENEILDRRGFLSKWMT